MDTTRQNSMASHLIKYFKELRLKPQCCCACISFLSEVSMSWYFKNGENIFFERYWFFLKLLNSTTTFYILLIMQRSLSFFKFQQEDTLSGVAPFMFDALNLSNILSDTHKEGNTVDYAICSYWLWLQSVTARYLIEFSNCHNPGNTSYCGIMAWC